MTGSRAPPEPWADSPSVTAGRLLQCWTTGLKYQNCYSCTIHGCQFETTLLKIQKCEHDETGHNKGHVTMSASQMSAILLAILP